jgi:hypothetical protein
LRISSSDANWWSAETGIEALPCESDPAGIVMLFACRIPATCSTEIPSVASRAGSSVTWITRVAPPVRLTCPTPARP